MKPIFVRILGVIIAIIGFFLIILSFALLCANAQIFVELKIFVSIVQHYSFVTFVTFTYPLFWVGMGIGTLGSTIQSMWEKHPRKFQKLGILGFIMEGAGILLLLGMGGWIMLGMLTIGGISPPPSPKQITFYILFFFLINPLTLSGISLSAAGFVMGKLEKRRVEEEG